MSRFEALGSFIYENGNRIGCTVEEGAVEIARKLNAYQMRVARLKAMPHNNDACPNLVRANLLETENARLKAEVEAQRRRIEALREAGDGLWYCLRHKGAVSPEERNDYIMEWTETRDGIKDNRV